MSAGPTPNQVRYAKRKLLERGKAILDSHGFKYERKNGMLLGDQFKCGVGIMRASNGEAMIYRYWQIGAEYHASYQIGRDTEIYYIGDQIRLAQHKAEQLRLSVAYNERGGANA